MPTLTDAQRERFLQILKDDRTIGNVRALQQAMLEAGGGKLFRGECNRILDNDPDLVADAREARGWAIEPIVSNLHAMAVDPKSPHAVRAATLILNGPHGEPGWRDQSRLELTGADGGPVEVDDVSAGLERFAALTASAVRAAGRTQAVEPDEDA